ALSPPPWLLLSAGSLSTGRRALNYRRRFHTGARPRKPPNPGNMLKAAGAPCLRDHYRITRHLQRGCRQPDPLGDQLDHGPGVLLGVELAGQLDVFATAVYQHDVV